MIGAPLDLAYEGEMVAASEDIVDGDYTLTNSDFTPFDDTAPDLSDFGAFWGIGDDFLNRLEAADLRADRDWRYNAPRFFDAVAGTLFGWD